MIIFFSIAINIIMFCLQLNWFLHLKMGVGCCDKKQNPGRIQSRESYIIAGEGEGQQY